MDAVRSLLLVPADTVDAAIDLGKAGPGAAPDATLVDLMHTGPASDEGRSDADGNDGDGVAKNGGYDTAAASVDALLTAGHRVYLHSRGPQSPDLRDQLLATLRPPAGDSAGDSGVYGISLPGVVHVDQLRFVDSLLEDVERRLQIEPGLTAIGLWIESAAALGRAGELAAASSRLTWLGIGATHLAAELRLDAPAPALLDHARARVVFAAQARNLAAVEGLPAASIGPDDAHLRSLGLRGRMTRHVSEVRGVHEAFPTP